MHCIWCSQVHRIQVHSQINYSYLLIGCSLIELHSLIIMTEITYATKGRKLNFKFIWFIVKVYSLLIRWLHVGSESDGNK